VLAGVIPKEDIDEYAEGIGVLERTEVKRRSYNFDDVHVSIEAGLGYTRYDSVTARIVAAKKIESWSKVTSLSIAALTLLHGD